MWRVFFTKQAQKDAKKLSAARLRPKAEKLIEILVSHQLVIPPPLIAELKNILNAKIGTPQEIISDFIELLTQDSILPEKTTLANIDIRDKDDIVIISTALNGNAEIVVTGDKELLELGIVQSMQIVSPIMFWEALKTQPPDEL
jgi:putative PIN family toxin of toxin-antitoxin system